MYLLKIMWEAFILPQKQCTVYLGDNLLQLFQLGQILNCIYFCTGLILILPCIDVFVKVDLRTVTCNIPPQEVMLTKDTFLEIKPISSLLHGQLRIHNMFPNDKRKDELNS